MYRKSPHDRHDNKYFTTFSGFSKNFATIPDCIAQIPELAPTARPLREIKWCPSAYSMELEQHR